MATKSSIFSSVISGSPMITLEKLVGSENNLSWSASVELWFMGQGYEDHLVTQDMDLSTYICQIASLKEEFLTVMPLTTDVGDQRIQIDKFFMVLTLIGLRPDLETVRDQILGSSSIPSLDDFLKLTLEEDAVVTEVEVNVLIAPIAISLATLVIGVISYMGGLPALPTWPSHLILSHLSLPVPPHLRAQGAPRRKVVLEPEAQGASKARALVKREKKKKKKKKKKKEKEECVPGRTLGGDSADHLALCRRRAPCTLKRRLRDGASPFFRRGAGGWRRAALSLGVPFRTMQLPRLVMLLLVLPTHLLLDLGFYILALLITYPGNKDLFSSITTTSALPTVTLSNGSQTVAKGIGLTHPLPSLPLTSVIYTPECSFNLISIRKITHTLNCSITFSDKICDLVGLEYGKTIGIGRESQGLYHLTSPSSPAIYISTDAPLLIHSRLGHPSLSKFQKMDKLSTKATKCIFLGYSRLQKGYRCYSSETHRYFLSADVTFFEDSPFFSTSKSLLVSEVLPLPIISPPDAVPSCPLKVYHCRHHVVVSPSLAEVPANSLPIPLATPAPTLPPSADLPIALRKGNQSTHNPHLIYNFLSYHQLSSPYSAFVSAISSVSLPKSTPEALSHPGWRQAMVDEMTALHSNGTWDLVVLPSSKSTVGCRWVYTVKVGPDGQLDIKNAFLHGNLAEEVYMEQPPGLVAQGESGLVCSTADHSVFYHHNSSRQCIYLVVYVDDIVITGNDQNGIQKLKQHLFTHFQTKDLGKLKYFLGIEIAQSSSGMVLSQRKYALDNLEETGMLDCKPVDSPMDPNVKLISGQGEPLGNHGRYRRLEAHQAKVCCTRTEIIPRVRNKMVRSSVEAEYRAMALATCELIWLKHLLRELRFGKDEQMKLICDNQAALHIASNPVFHERTKHIEVDYHFIREKIASGCMATSFVNSNDQLSDIFTKSLRGPRIKYICNKLGAYNIYAPA
ncbi:Retrovirus-related Pol polyprotein from transposon RE1 [Vitis vinifera]|uniref:Retrovirus-related Pol polyprotein from transposon RE1 n=2 Tax=Vitis vinifera TaxID=29760 RepID=A0A438GIJ5_VITVI|nr:Retrovirus-related Pol polyprotein from transposon RE1 [Vitis vinifera]